MVARTEAIWRSSGSIRPTLAALVTPVMSPPRVLVGFPVLAVFVGVVLGEAAHGVEQG